MTAPSTFELYRNTWKASKATPEVLLSLQTALLNEIVAFARLRFTVYAELYHGVPEKISGPEDLPISQRPYCKIQPR